MLPPRAFFGDAGLGLRGSKRFGAAIAIASSRGPTGPPGPANPCRIPREACGRAGVRMVFMLSAEFFGIHILLCCFMRHQPQPAADARKTSRQSQRAAVATSGAAQLPQSPRGAPEPADPAKRKPDSADVPFHAS